MWQFHAFGGPTFDLVLALGLTIAGVVRSANYETPHATGLTDSQILNGPFPVLSNRVKMVCSLHSQQVVCRMRPTGKHWNSATAQRAKKVSMPRSIMVAAM